MPARSRRGKLLARGWAGEDGRGGEALPFGRVEVALGEGLVLRAAGKEDVDRLVAFNERIHGMPDQVGMAEQLGGAVRSLMSGRTPGIGAGDFLLVEDTRSGAVASSLCVLGQSWRYEGIAFDVDQIEFVGTDPAYRRRGLVRRQMDLVHRHAAGQGRLVQVIDGIDWYYRQFGYDYALQASRGGRLLPLAAGAGGPARLRTRPAGGGDAGFIEAAYRAGMERYQVSVDRDRRWWLADLEGFDPGNYHRPALRVIEDEHGQPVGYCSYWASFHNPARPPIRLWIGSLELAPGQDWASWGRSLVDCLQDLSGTLAAERDVSPPPVTARLGDAHPFYDLAVGQPLDPREGNVWYVRVDVPGFLRRAAPALEGRLARSPAAGHSGTLSLSFYRDGVRLRFEHGRMVAVERWAEPGQDEGDAWFPELTFFQVLLGYRSMAQIERAYPDCGARDGAAHELVDALFPKGPSYTWLIV